MHCNKNVDTTCHSRCGAAGEICAASVTEGGGDATSGSETEGEEQKDRLAAEPGAFSSTVEGKMFEYMQQLVDNARGLQVEQAAQAKGRTVRACERTLTHFLPQTQKMARVPSLGIGYCMSRPCMMARCHLLQK